MNLAQQVCDAACQERYDTVPWWLWAILVVAAVVLVVLVCLVVAVLDGSV